MTIWMCLVHWMIYNINNIKVRAHGEHGEMAFK